MRIRRFTLSNILLYVIIGFTMLLIQHIALFGSNPNGDMSIAEAAVVSTFIILLSCLYFYNEKKNGGLKINFVLIVILLILFACNIVASFIFPSEIQFTIMTEDYGEWPFYAEVLFETRILNLFVTAGILYFIYLILDVVPQKIYDLKQLRFILYGLVILSFVSIICSLAVGGQSYSNMLAGDVGARVDICSFTNNPNNYAAILFFGTLSCVFLNYLSKNKWWYLPIAIIFVATVFTVSRTYIISSILLIIGYLVLRLVKTFKVHKKRNIILGTVMVALIGGTIGSYLLCTKFEVVDYVLPLKLIKIFFERAKTGTNGRNFIWKETIVIFNETNCWALGGGFGLFTNVDYQIQYCIYQEAGSSSPHNGILQMIGNGGIVFLSFVFLVAVYLIFVLVKMFKKHNSLFWICAFVLVTFGFQMMSEAPAPLTPGSPVINYLFMSLFAIVPIISTYVHDCHKKEHNEIVKSIEEYKPTSVRKSNVLFSQTITFILSALSIVIFGVLFIYCKDNSVAQRFSIIVLPVMILCSFVAYLVEAKSFSFKQYLVEILLPYLVLDSLLIGMGHVCLKYLESSVLIFVWMWVLLPILFTFIFACIPYFRNKSGYFYFIFKKITYKLGNRFFKDVDVKDDTSKQTLYQKLTYKITPKKLR